MRWRLPQKKEKICLAPSQLLKAFNVAATLLSSLYQYCRHAASCILQFHACRISFQRRA